jgi:flavin-binding protein dodecin
MADPIYKVVEVVGTSEQSISKAIDNAINKATRPLEHYEISAGSKSSKCAVRSRTARFNAIRSL